MSEFKFAFGDHVVWDAEKNKIPIGRGVIIGTSSTPMPILGRMWIVQLERRVSDEYPFTAISIPEIALSFSKEPAPKKEPYLCKDCNCPIVGNYVSQHFHCTDVHPDDR